jgi:putative SOS response-associated peptidase YedK
MNQDRTTAKFRWGLIPPWAKDLAIGNRMMNARSETLDTKPSFRKAFVARRCLIPSDGYYEWKNVSDGKQPYLIEPKSGLFAMAGLWEENTKLAANGETLRTTTIITTEANETTSGVHHRMPVLLDESNFETWLDPNFRDLDTLKNLLVPAPNDALKLTAVSRHVNRATNDDPGCVEPAATQFTLDFE